MESIEAQIAHYDAERARNRKLGFRFGYIALGFLALNILSGLAIYPLLNNIFASGSNLAIFQVSELLQLGLPICGIIGISFRNRAVKARRMIDNLKLVQAEVTAKANNNS